jgi:hypothetical protein
MVPGAVLRGVTLDCADAQTLAGFYGALTGMRELFSTGEFVASRCYAVVPSGTYCR